MRQSYNAIMLRSNHLLILTLLLISSPAFAKDCTPVETAPGVKTKPAGCSSVINEVPPKKANMDRLPSSGDGWIHYKDGTKVKVFGRTGVEVGVSR
jgi:hypothetical protein